MGLIADLKKRSRGRPRVGKTRTIRVSDKDWESWRATASASDKELSEFIRAAVNEKCDSYPLNIAVFPPK